MPVALGAPSALTAGTSIACTALGPMPTATGMVALPAGRPSVDLQIAALPGHYLSVGAEESPKGAAITQAALLIEPDSLIGIPGVVSAHTYASAGLALTIGLGEGR